MRSAMVTLSPTRSGAASAAWTTVGGLLVAKVRPSETVMSCAINSGKTNAGDQQQHDLMEPAAQHAEDREDEHRGCLGCDELTPLSPGEHIESA